MLKAIGAGSIEELFADIPERFRIAPGGLNLPAAHSEAAIVRRFRRAAAKNRHAGDMRCFLGAGTYHHFVPAAVDYVISRGEFLTAYTPYQPEISQGTLAALFEFQTMVARLTGMEVANASMYDAATAVAEAALMARRVTRRERIVLASSVHPVWRRVSERYLAQVPEGVETVEGPRWRTDADAVAGAVDGRTAGVIVQYPDFYGHVFDLAPIRRACDETGALMIVCFGDATAFGLIEPPGAFGADIVAGSGQALGIPMSFGGPHIGLFATRERFIRQMPGRVCGQTVDAEGRRGYVLTLSTREQHIRREKATSNICSNQGLMCTAVACHLSLLGDRGLEEVARRSAGALARLVAGLPEGVRAAEGPRYNETVVAFPDAASRARFLARAEEAGIFAGIPLDRFVEGEDAALLVATTEMIEPADVDDWLACLREALA